MDSIETDDEMAVKIKVGSLISLYTGSTDTNAHPELPTPKVDSIEIYDEMAIKIKVGSRESINHSSYTSFSSNYS